MMIWALGQRNCLFYNPRAAGGGTYVPPHRFLEDRRKMAARSAAKFRIPVHSFFAHLV